MLASVPQAHTPKHINLRAYFTDRGLGGFEQRHSLTEKIREGGSMKRRLAVEWLVLLPCVVAGLVGAVVMEYHRIQQPAYGERKAKDGIVGEWNGSTWLTVEYTVTGRYSETLDETG
jgi:hypothetical protein